ncbi:hypothetical protein BJ944DRAFT_267629 [Cunninghamella echinulata]|nr:hypothetical protein BJ944DRAFT_267629 [Cunninghamella echinulata]
MVIASSIIMQIWKIIYIVIRFVAIVHLILERFFTSHYDVFVFQFFFFYLILPLIFV